MANNTKTTKSHEPLFHIAKRPDVVWWQAWLIRIAAIVLGFLITGLISVVLTQKGLGDVYSLMFRGTFGRLFEGKTSMLWRFLQQTAILLCLSLAVTPAFKMRFWNCGAEGQALIGALASIICMAHLGNKLPYGVLIIVVIAASIVAGAVWGVIPAIFKAKYKTNETLFTLMMNYIATYSVSFYVLTAFPKLTTMPVIKTGNLPVIAGQPYLLNILVVAAITILLYVYLRYSKHGYEVAVVGESQKTAKYIGINVKKVIIRTMLISGAICGVAGMLLVAGTDHSINTNTVGGQGFTAIMVSWLGQFNPFIIAIMSGLVVFLQTGAAKIADSCFLNSSYADIVTGIIILFLVGCEFFIQYTVKFRHSKKEGK